MSLSGALQIGRSALLANQAAIDVTGNNLANIATRGYHRQVVSLAPSRDQELMRGIFLGRGVQIQAITRQVDNALEARVRDGLARESATLARRDLLSQIEALQNELSGHDLSSYLGSFFNAFSELANNPDDLSLRNLVVQQGKMLSEFMQNLRGELTTLRTQVDASIDNAATAANDLLSRIAQLNRQITAADTGTTGAHALRDQRDQLLAELATFMDISTVEQPSGVVDVFVGSLPVVLNGQSRGLEVRRQSIEGQLRIEVVIKDDGSVLQPASGRLGALIQSREGDVNHAIEALDQFAGHLIHQVNRVHSQGQGSALFSSVTGSVKVADTTVPLNDPAAGLAFVPGHGSFQIHVTQTSTGQRSSRTIDIDLDGINGASDTSLSSLVAALNATGNITASITSDGRLKIAGATADDQVSFSDDSSGVLAALGINTFFSGTTAADIAVNSVVAQNPAYLAAGLGHVPGDNRNALALAGLRTRDIDAMGGLSLTQIWNRHVEDYSIRLGQANLQLEADIIVRENLQAQQQSVGGVNADEEAINLLAYQRAYQGSARFLTVVDELLKTLLNLV